MEKIFNFLRLKKIYKVTVMKFDDGNKYVIDDKKQKKINAKKTDTLIFEISNQHYENHPFRFSKTNDSIHNNGEAYTNGVVVNSDEQTTNITINLKNVGTKLYYYCEKHKGMGSIINIKSSSNYSGY